MERFAEKTVERARQGDKEALEKLVREASPGVFRFILNMVRSEEEARDLTQETFLRAVRHLDRYDPAYSFNTWLYRIARNLCIDRARRSSRWRWSPGGRGDDDRGDPMCDHPDPRESQLDELLDQERRRILEGAVGRLKPKYREVIVLYHFEELSYQEIARVLGIPLGTVMNRIFRARRQLRAALEGESAVVGRSGALEVAR